MNYFGFELGVDEYITKPFSPKILVARVESILNRLNNITTSSINSYGNLIIDTTSRTVSIKGNLIDFSLREFDLLNYLTTNKNIALSRDKILNNVWNYDFYGDSRTIDSHIKKIRAKLGLYGEYIQTIRGYGYKFKIKEEINNENSIT